LCSELRDKGFAALAETYRYVGARIWSLIGEKENTRSAQVIQQLRACFAEIDASTANDASCAGAPAASAGDRATARTQSTVKPAPASRAAALSTPAQQLTPTRAARSAVSRAATEPLPSDAASAVRAPPQRVMLASSSSASSTTSRLARANTSISAAISSAPLTPGDELCALFGVSSVPPAQVASVSAAVARIEALGEPLKDVVTADWQVRC
jgi:hypothetical protein